MRSPQNVQVNRPPFNRAMSLDSTMQGNSTPPVRNIVNFPVMAKQGMMGSPRMMDGQDSYVMLGTGSLFTIVRSFLSSIMCNYLEFVFFSILVCSL